MGYDGGWMLNARGTRLHFVNGVPNGDIRMAGKRGKKKQVRRRNPLGKYAHRFNHSRVHRDRTKYWRKGRWQELEK